VALAIFGSVGRCKGRQQAAGRLGPQAGGALRRRIRLEPLLAGPSKAEER